MRMREVHLVSFAMAHDRAMARDATAQKDEEGEEEEQEDRWWESAEEDEEE